VKTKYFFAHSHPKLEDKLRDFFLFLDFDGTLVPIQGDPARCSLLPEAKERLKAIASAGRTYIAIISGRTAKDIKKRVPVQGIYYGGSHGLEISGPGLRYVHPDALKGRSVISAIYRLIQAKTEKVDGVFVEKKRFGFSLHFRMADRKVSTIIKNSFYRTVSERPEPRTFVVLRGKKVLELAPNINWDKGKAALFLLQKEKKNYLPIYVGDDLTDETAFKALKEKGITIRVGRSKKTAAKYYLKGQWEVSRLLKYINELTH